MYMKNVGQLDSSIRLLLSLVMLYLGWMYGGAVSYVLYALSLILIWTAVTGNCFVYNLLGIDTFKPGFEKAVRKVAAQGKPASKPAKKAVKKRK